MNRPTACLFPRFQGERERKAPHGFSCAPMTVEQRKFLENQALEIFAEMSNRGFSFREALLAIYVSGINLAIELKS